MLCFSEIFVQQESVLILKQQRLDWSVNGSTTDPCCMNASHPVVTDKDAIFLDVPRTITADIHAARKDLMKCILRHESAIERLEDLWATKVSMFTILVEVCFFTNNIRNFVLYEVTIAVSLYFY